MVTSEKRLCIYQLPEGRAPFLEWLGKLKDRLAKQKIQARLTRIRLGNLGNTIFVGRGVRELKIDHGPGYRLYFGQDGEELVILLCGGDKSTQNEDIQKAKQYWTSYKKEKRYANY